MTTYSLPTQRQVSLLLGRTDICGRMAEDEIARYHHVHKASAEPIRANCSLPVSFKIGEKGAEPEPLEARLLRAHLRAETFRHLLKPVPPLQPFSNY